MPKNYRNSDISTPKNTLEGSHRYPIFLGRNLLEFQRMAYNFQLAEKNIKFPNPEIVIWISNQGKYKPIQNNFEDLLEYLFEEEMKVRFEQGSEITSGQMQPLFEYEYDYLSLFSGGLDSISIPFQDKYRKKRGIMHHTITNPSPYGKAKAIFKEFFKGKMNVAFTTSIGKNKVTDPVYMKTRGLIFLTNALCVASEHKIKEVIVPENGVFMRNLSVSYMADPTTTTDPFMIKEWTKIFNKVTNSRVRCVTPFLEMTKSEVILSTGNRDLIPATWSCSYFQGRKKMCGICNSCLVRILSCYAIDEGENIEKFYSQNTFTVDHNEFGDINLETYRISSDAIEYWINLVNPERLSEIDKQRFLAILENNPIMKRHSLDMFLGFQKLSKRYDSKQSLFVKFKKMLKLIDKSVLDARYEHLMNYKEKQGWD